MVLPPDLSSVEATGLHLWNLLAHLRGKIESYNCNALKYWETVSNLLIAYLELVTSLTSLALNLWTVAPATQLNSKLLEVFAELGAFIVVRIVYSAQL